jgi:hypothetical protein
MFLLDCTEPTRSRQVETSKVANYHFQSQLAFNSYNDFHDIDQMKNVFFYGSFNTVGEDAKNILFS